eukprot:1978839-Amphidinium_carterae.1
MRQLPVPFLANSHNPGQDFRIAEKVMHTCTPDHLNGINLPKRGEYKTTNRVDTCQRTKWVQPANLVPDLTHQFFHESAPSEAIGYWRSRDGSGETSGLIGQAPIGIASTRTSIALHSRSLVPQFPLLVHLLPLENTTGKIGKPPTGRKLVGIDSRKPPLLLAKDESRVGFEATCCSRTGKTGKPPTGRDLVGIDSRKQPCVLRAESQSACLSPGQNRHK